MKKERLESMTKKELLVVAKELQIVGRHAMSKAELIDALLSYAAPEETKEVAPKNDYIEDARIGTIIAFKVNDKKVLSGKIEEIHKGQFVVETKNGVKFTVKKNNIIWVKTGLRWPKGVYLALKGGSVDEYKRHSQGICADYKTT